MFGLFKRQTASTFAEEMTTTVGETAIEDAINDALDQMAREGGDPNYEYVSTLVEENTGIQITEEQYLRVSRMYFEHRKVIFG